MHKQTSSVSTFKTCINMNQPKKRTNNTNKRHELPNTINYQTTQYNLFAQLPRSTKQNNDANGRCIGCAKEPPPGQWSNAPPDASKVRLRVGSTFSSDGKLRYRWEPRSTTITHSSLNQPKPSVRCQVMPLLGALSALSCRVFLHCANF